MQLLHHLNRQGQVIVIDDESFTLEIMRMQFERLELDEKRLWLFQDANIGLNHFKKILDRLILPEEAEDRTLNVKINIQPVSFLILDIDMPIVSGLEICSKIKALYTEK